MTNLIVASLLADVEQGTELVWPTRFLVVDDSAATRRFLRTVLECCPSFEVAGEAHDGASAVEMARALQPDVVLLDLAMPVVDGAVALREIRREVPEALVVIVSGTDPHRAPSLLAAGATAFIAKGLPPFELLDRLGRILDNRTPSRPTSVESPPVVQVGEVGSAAHQVVVCDDDPMTRKLVGQVMTGSGLTVAADVDTVPDLLSVVQLAQPQLVVLDLWLEGISGTSAIQQILARAPSTLVIAYSAHAEWAEDALRAGATAFVAKPNFVELGAQARQLMSVPA